MLHVKSLEYRDIKDSLYSIIEVQDTFIYKSNKIINNLISVNKKYEEMLKIDSLIISKNETIIFQKDAMIKEQKRKKNFALAGCSILTVLLILILL